MHTNDIPHARPVAIIAPNARGGWTLLLPDASREIGNYDTPQRAADVATLNGYAPQIQEAAP